MKTVNRQIQTKICEQDREVCLTGADGHLRAASCCEVLKDDCQLTTTRELQTEGEEDLIRLFKCQNITSTTSNLTLLFV